MTPTGFVSTAMMRAPSSAGTPIVGVWLAGAGGGVGGRVRVGAGVAIAVAVGPGVDVGIGVALPAQPADRTRTARPAGT